MRAGRLFAALAAVALLFSIGVTVYAGATARSVELAGEVLYGERSEASGVSVQQNLSAREHMVWQLDWDAGAATAENGYRWTLLPTVYLPGQMSSTWPRLSISGLVLSPSIWFMTAGEIEIYEDSYAAYADALRDGLNQYGPDGEFTYSFTLNDYTGYYPLSFEAMYLNCVNGGETLDIYSTYLESMRVPLSGEVRMELNYTNFDSVASAEFMAAGDAEIWAQSDSICTPEGYFYFVFGLRDGTDFELLDGSELPGGDWGLFRMRVTNTMLEDRSPNGATQLFPLDEENSQGRWWVETGFEVDVDAGNIENVCDLGRDWDAAWLELSYDGQSVLLYTQRGGEIWLTVLDSASGEVLQDEKLFTLREPMSAEDAIYFSSLPVTHYAAADRTVFVYDYGGEMYARTASYGSGRYTVEEITVLTPPELDDVEFRDEDLRSFACDGERLAVLSHIYYERGGEYDCALLLRIYRGGELTYAELIHGERHYIGEDTEHTEIVMIDGNGFEEQQKHADA
ncbi:MAG TPA: hypothetical protein IAB47_04610 [Candidatus Scatomorpha merdigallinarum]|nr:hypothetical protein [Candidatus Scatomorpha merdigallinarum]